MFGTKELKITKERYDNTLNLYNDVMDIIVNKSQFLYNMKKIQKNIYQHIQLLLTNLKLNQAILMKNTKNL